MKLQIISFSFKKKLWIYAVIFYLFSNSSFSQVKDTVYVNQLLKESISLRKAKNYEASKSMLDEAIKISESINYYVGMSDSYYELGKVHFDKTEYEMTIASFEKALSSLSDNNIKDQNRNIKFYTGIGTIYYYMDNFQEASKNYLIAMNYSEGEIDGNVIRTLNGLGIVYYILGEYQKSMPYYIKVYDFCKNKEGETNLWAMSTLNIGLCYSQLENSEMSFKYYFEALDIVDGYTNEYLKRQVRISIAKEYEKQGKLDTALKYILQVKRLKNNLKNEAEALELLGDIYKAQNKKELAKKVYLETLEVLDASNQNKEKRIRISVSKSLSTLYLESKNHQKAYQYLEHYTRLKDSTFTQKIAEVTTRSMVLFETEKKDKELVSQKVKLKAQENLLLKRKTRNLYVILSLIASLFIVFGLYQRKIFKFKDKYNKILKLKNIRLEKAKQKVVKAMDTKKSLLNGITHELKTPLQTISSISQLLNGDRSIMEKKYLETIDFSVANLLNLIDNAIAVNEENRGTMVLNIEPFNLLKVFNSFTDSLLISNNTDNELHIETDSKLQDLIVLGDEGKLIQVLYNIIDNAYKYTKSGRVILKIEALDLSSKMVNLQFTVSDTGIGIEKVHLDKIFEHFYKEEENIRLNTSGMGLGLSTVKKILDLHQGTINVESKKDEGTTFCFSLKYEILQEVKIVNGKTRNIDPSKINVLLVEDHKINQLLLKNVIEKEGFINCHLASNGLEAVNLFKKENFDIVLTDIMMPDMNGFESSKIMKLLNPNIPIIAITASSKEEKSFKEAQIDRVIYKPIDPELLYKAMYTMLG